MQLRRVCTLLLVSCVPAAFAANVSFQKGDGQIEVSVDGKPFTTFYYGPPAPKPYLHPLRAADGTIVTRLYPMENVEGETHDHPHHRGLWFTHGNVNGLDFWANEPNQEGVTNPGKIVLRKIEQVDNASGTIRASFDWQTPDGKLVLTEDRTMVFNGDAGRRTIDFDVTFTAGPEPVKFGDTKEGMFAIRLATPLEEPHPRAKGPERTGKIVNAEGKTGEKNNWGKRSAWVDYSGKLNGKPVGVAIFDNPSNPKHPTYWHVRSYGLFAANIFGEHDFYDDKTKDGSVTVEPGKALRFRYRVVIHAGDTQTAGIADLYKAYAKTTMTPSR
jgi:Family of unknown function (DUF6807)